MRTLEQLQNVKIGDMTPDERRTVIQAACGQLEAEMKSSAALKSLLTPLAHDADLTAEPQRKCLCGRTFSSRTELFRHVDRANGHTRFPEDAEGGSK